MRYEEAIEKLNKTAAEELSEKLLKLENREGVSEEELENLLYKSVLKGDVVSTSYERVECDRGDYIKLRLLAECEEEIAEQAEITQADLDYATAEWLKKIEQQKIYDAM